MNNGKYAEELGQDQEHTNGMVFWDGNRVMGETGFSGYMSSAQMLAFCSSVHHLHYFELKWDTSASSDGRYGNRLVLFD